MTTIPADPDPPFHNAMPSHRQAQLDQFEKKLATIGARATALSERATASTESGSILSGALDELAASVEALHVAREQLNGQGQELATTTHQLEVERQRYQDLFNRAPETYLVTDGYATIREANHAAAELFGTPVFWLAGKPLSLFVIADDRQPFFRWLTMLRRLPQPQPDTRRYRADFRLRSGQSASRQVEASVTFMPSPDGDATQPLLRWLMRDITARKQTEDDLRESHEQMVAFAQRLEEAREEERTRVAREVHDELGQALTALKMETGLFAQKLPKDAPELQEQMHGILSSIDATIYSMRAIMTNLRPPMLDDIGLVGTIEWQCHDFQTRAGILCRFVCSVDQVCVDKEQATALFRLTQEILTNVARHAQATHVTIKLGQSKGSVSLAVQDNGRGITKDEIDNRHSAGLTGMRERVRLMNGRLEIRGKPNKGTTVRVRVPCGQHPVP